ncbi:MAG: M20 family metallopeptidase [Candidatus Korobacteraceae bacterium]
MKTQRRPSSATRPSAAPSAEALLKFARKCQKPMLATLRRFVEAESPSLEKAAVDKLGKLLATELTQRGGRVRFHPAKRFGDHLQADFLSGSGKPILLLGHFDTVWPLGTLKRMPWRQTRDRLFGPGVLDMKSGITQMLFALDALKAAHGIFPRPFRVLLVTDEEVGSESSRQVIESLAKKSAAVLVLEFSAGLEGALKTARKGVGVYTVQVTGRAAHAGNDFENGHSAILELARQILQIEKFTDLKRGITVSPGIIRGGTRTNVIAASAEVDVDVRVRTMADAASLDRKFRALKPFDRHCRIEIKGNVGRPPFERTPQVAELFRFAQNLGLAFGLNLQEKAVGGGSDGNFTASLGIPTLDGLGGVGEGAHAENESVLIAELAPRTALLARLIETVNSQVRRAY